jgi:signal transduction histidine kinase
VTALRLPAPDVGFHLAYQNGEVEVSSVDYGSAAQSGDMQSGVVVTWLNGQYLLGMSDQAKRDLVQSGGPWVTLRTTTRDQVAAEEAAYTKLAAVARQSDTPWLANPEANPVPACYLDGTCIPFETRWQADGGSFTYSILSPMVEGAALCLPTDGNQVSVSFAESLLQPDGAGSYAVYATGAQFCVLGSPVPGASPYGYIGASDQLYFRDWWMPVGSDPGPAILGFAILLFGWLIVGRGWAGSTLKPFALTLPLATAVPLLVVPIDRYPTLATLVAGSILVPMAMLPLAIDFLDRMDRGWRRSLVTSVTVGLALGSAGCGLLMPAGAGLVVLRAFLAGCVPFVPGLFAARPFHRLESGAIPGRSRWRGVAASGLTLIPGPFAARLARRLEFGSAASSGPTPRALIDRVDILLAAMTPGIAAICLTSPYRVEVEPLMWWLAALLVATRLIVRPLGRLATVAVRQRDLVVAATEAERTRIAADIHDDALQDLTMLVRRLDAAGDAQNAQAARDIAERLRAICGDLRLPVLDDLGVGPALDWLCGRLDVKTEPITLDRLDGEARLPADVELAVFRIAQEALSNAVRHGAPPVVVRYRARDGWVELEVDDAGPGIADGAAELAEKTGHLGLLNMTQRSEAVGARLSIRGRPGGGTRVSLVWERASSTNGAVAAIAPA